MQRHYLQGIFLLLMLLPEACLAAGVVDQTIDKIERDLEVERYQALAQVQADPHNRLAPFVTDGCSGGLSDGWRFLAKTLPPFQHKFGDKPPYESCCVTHDRAYWRGETRHGFDKRLSADKALQQCVVRFGKDHRAQFAAEFHMSPELIDRNFEIVAALMYRAVRVGGRPCTPFSWRWGYGWPPCREQDLIE